MSTSMIVERPLATVDIAIFAVRDGALNVLLVQRPKGAGEPFPGSWALPGGFVDVRKDASLEACAIRKLSEKTGVRAPYLEQLGFWGGAKRDPRGWSVTCAYFALIVPPESSVKGGNAIDLRWWPVEGSNKPVRLAFDHGDVLGTALQRLRSKVEYTSLPAFLMPDQFTLPELQAVYESILGRALDKSAFRTRTLAADFLEPTREMRLGANRPAQVYRLLHRDLVYFPRPFAPRTRDK